MKNRQATTSAERILLGQRYELKEALGSGSMGQVFKAYDLLNAEMVALKRVELSSTAGLPLEDLRSAHTVLIQEFRTLTALRHPNIIRVLDFGFDQHKQPFYTMDFLENPSTIVAAGQGQPLDFQIDLLAQALSALAYLHRHDILHRDLKPDNLLVNTEGNLKILDFGLSSLPAHKTERAGTLQYMAPEVIETGIPEKASDIYSLGIIAYQLFMGQHPFPAEIPSELLQKILSSEPNLSGCHSPEMAQLLKIWLARDPDERYTNIQTLMTDLYALVKSSPPQESLAVRESYSHAAAFIGRHKEMELLMDAFNQSQSGKGDCWLVSGESGVGKSRLVDQFRMNILVEGAWVVGGQAVQEGHTPFKLWEKPLHQLALTCDLNEEELNVLQTILPDLRRLPGNNLPTAPRYDPKVFQMMLFNLLMRMLNDLDSPLVIVLEDLQWAGSGSLTLLSQLLHKIEILPVLVVCTCREDESQLLINDLPEAHLLTLPRLSEIDMKNLIVSVLGEAGKRPDLLSFLQRETEGNPFFLVEIVDVLAQHSGQLLDITSMAIPEKIVAGGIEAVVTRKLEQLPADVLPLLQFAAIAGRDIDLKLLTALHGGNIESWLVDCEATGIIEARENQWRFSHDKLREGLLEGLSGSLRKAAYQQVAEAIEQQNPDDAGQFSRLAHLWNVAGMSEKTAYYSLKTGEQSRRVYANAEAIKAFQQVIVCMESNPVLQTTHADWHIQALSELGKVFYDTGILNEAKNALTQAIDLGKKNNLERSELITLFHWLGEVFFWLNDLESRLTLGQEGLALLGEDTRSFEAALMNQLIAVAYRFGREQMEPWQKYTLRTAEFLRELPYQEELRPAFIHIFMVYREMRRLEIGLEWLAQMAQHARHRHDIVALAEANLFQAQANYFRGDFKEAEQYYQMALENSQKIGDSKREFWALQELHMIDLNVHGDLASALQRTQTAKAIAKSHNFQEDNYAELCCDVGLVQFCLGNIDQAFQNLEEAYYFSQTNHYRYPGLWAAYLLGRTYLALKDWKQARTWLEIALAAFTPDNLKGQTGLDTLTLFSAYESAQAEGNTLPPAPQGFFTSNNNWDSDSINWMGHPSEPQTTQTQADQMMIFGPNSPEGWSWQDPFGDCRYELRSGLTIHAANGRQLWHSNLSAPRWTCLREGEFITQTICRPAKPDQPAIGGILIWQDADNFLWLARDLTGPGEVCFAGCLDNQSVAIGRARLSLDGDAGRGTYLRLERTNKKITAYAAVENGRWFTAGQAAFPSDTQVEIGLFAWGAIPRHIYPEIHPDGSALRFQVFWCLPV